MNKKNTFLNVFVSLLLCAMAVLLFLGIMTNPKDLNGFGFVYFPLTILMLLWGVKMSTE